MSAPATFALSLATGAFAWTLGEYLLHRFAMHHLKGKGIMSREHLEHHVHSTWTFSSTLVLAWIGVVLVGTLGFFPIGWLIGGVPVGAGLGLGWIVGYFFYEHQHAMSHRRGPSGRYTAWLRRHHFHHHFGHPMANHGVSTALWDHVFGTWQDPGVVRVPRRLVLPWLVDEQGELRPQYVGSYVLVGNPDSTARLAELDRIRAFASVAPSD